MKKICKKCGRNRKIGKFGKLTAKPDGKNIYCRDCMREFTNNNYKYTIKGKLIKRKSAKKYKRRNKEYIKEYNRQYYLKNKNRILYKIKAKKCTESILIIENKEKSKKKKINKTNGYTVVINPKRKEDG